MLVLAGSGRNVVVSTDGGPASQRSIFTHLPSPAKAGDTSGFTAGGSYGGSTTGFVVVVVASVVVVVFCAEGGSVALV